MLALVHIGVTDLQELVDICPFHPDCRLVRRLSLEGFHNGVKHRGIGDRLATTRLALASKQSNHNDKQMQDGGVGMLGQRLLLLSSGWRFFAIMSHRCTVAAT